MPRTISCPGCGRNFNVPAEAEGKLVRCPDCQTQFRIEPESADGGYGLADEPASAAPAPAAPPKRAAADPPPQELPGASTYIQHAGIQRERPPKKQKAKSRSRKTALAGRFAYLPLVLLLVPLAWTLLLDVDDPNERLERSLAAHPEVLDELDEQELLSEREELEFLIRALPGGRIDGAHLARDTKLHWVYGLVSGGLIFATVILCFPRGNVRLYELGFVAAGIGITGVVMLIVFQWIAMFSLLIPMAGGPIGWFFIGILKLIGYSYRSALDPDASFWLSFFGFTMGVGLCEEFVKAFPIITYFRSDDELSWHAACLWGLTAGIGFGVAEGILYSADQYNGIFGLSIYLVRFFSCVTLHAVWGATAALLAWRHQELLAGEEWTDWLQIVLFVLGIPMVLHGLYDTCLKMEYNAAALGVALLSFGVLAALVEWSYQEDG